MPRVPRPAYTNADGAILSAVVQLVILRRGVRADRHQLAQSRLEPRQLLAGEQCLAGEADAHRIDRHAAPIDFIVEVRPGRHARRADIADQLALVYETARRDDDPAHMAVTGPHPGSMRQPDLLAITAGPAGPDHLPVGSSYDRSTIMGAEIDAAVHPREVQDRVEANAKAGRYRRSDRPSHRRDLLTGTISVDPVGAAGEGPFHQADGGRPGPVDRSIEQRAFLAFSSGGAAIGDDQVEPVIRTDLRTHIDLRRQGAKIFACRLGLEP